MSGNVTFTRDEKHKLLIQRVLEFGSKPTPVESEEIQMLKFHMKKDELEREIESKRERERDRESEIERERERERDRESEIERASERERERERE